MTYTVRVTNGIGKTNTARMAWRPCRVFGMGDSFSSGEGGGHFSALTATG